MNGSGIHLPGPMDLQQRRAIEQAMAAQAEQQRQTIATLASREAANVAEAEAWRATTAAREAEARYWRELIEAPTMPRIETQADMPASSPSSTD